MKFKLYISFEKAKTIFGVGLKCALGRFLGSPKGALFYISKVPLA